MDSTSIEHLSEYCNAGFIALAAAGVLLGMVRCATGHIGECIGMHAGWVLVIKVVRKTTELDDQSYWSFLVASYDDVIGVLAFIWFLLLAITYYAVYSRYASREYCHDAGSSSGPNSVPRHENLGNRDSGSPRPADTT